MTTGPFVFPAGNVNPATAVVLTPDADRLPFVSWLGVATGATERFAFDAAALRAAGPPTPLLAEHSRGSYRRPGLRGYRAGRPAETGRDWSTSFTVRSTTVDDTRVFIDSADDGAGLAMRTDLESLPGGGLRMRHILTNMGDEPYIVDALEVSLPVADTCAEVLDFTGRHERERTPQRHPVRDGLWLRENRRGRTGLESASMLVTGTAGFGFGTGEVVGVHVAHSGNSVHWVEREPGGATCVGGGELLLPGELTLERHDSYATPWVFVVASGEGLDGVAASLHAWLRSLPAHPAPQPIVLNVWEAVYFDHDQDRLAALADRAARVGVERFVLDDGWFLGRRDDTAGLGDWWVDEQVWPKGLQPLIDHVHGLGMQFGLWFEPEMVNPDSGLYRTHPDWVLGAPGRVPHLSRHQLVLDLTNPDVWWYLLERMDSLLDEYAIDYVKWDHNRDVLEAGATELGVPAVHRQSIEHYSLLDELRRRHPHIAWESCAAGGGRIDLGVLERVQRVWTSDMTDALARQQIQRWTGQFVAPEYLGAHVSATHSHQTGRTFSLDFRAATALFGSYGIEWDLTQASDDELDRLSEWSGRYRQHRVMLQSGRVVRAESSDPAVWLHGVVAADRSGALMAHVQLDESASNRGVVLRVPHLRPELDYTVSWAAPPNPHPMSQSPAVDPAGPTAGRVVTGAALRDVGIWLPRRRPETILLMHIEAVV